MSLRIVTENKLIFSSLSLFYKHFSLRASIESILFIRLHCFHFRWNLKTFQFSEKGDDKLTISFSAGIRFLGVLRGLQGKHQCQAEPKTKSTILLLGFVKNETGFSITRADAVRKIASYPFLVFFIIFMTGLKKVKWDRHSILIINFLGFIAIARHLNANGGCSRSGKGDWHFIGCKDEKVALTLTHSHWNLSIFVFNYLSFNIIYAMKKCQENGWVLEHLNPKQELSIWIEKDVVCS